MEEGVELLFHPHILEIKTCLASARARLAAKSRENAQTRGLCRSPRAFPCVTHPVPVPRPAGLCPCALSPLPRGCLCQPGTASASLCSSRAREGAVCLSVCLSDDLSLLGRGRKVPVAASESSAAFIRAQKLGCSLFLHFLAGR